MVRLPCGSMSTHSTRWPCSANAAARLSVVVVLATPPFWLAKAITRAVLASAEEQFKPDTSPLFARAGAIPSPGLRARVRALLRGSSGHAPLGFVQSAGRFVAEAAGLVESLGTDASVAHWLPRLLATCRT